jgi:hypothetical protein
MSVNVRDVNLRLVSRPRQTSTGSIGDPAPAVVLTDVDVIKSLTSLSVGDAANNKIEERRHLWNIIPP